MSNERRFYIHEESFRDLCADFPEHEEGVLVALGLLVASRMARHHLILNGEELGLARPGTFAPVVEQLDARARTHLTDLFHGLVYSPPGAHTHDETAAVLAPYEAVCAVCWEGGYFTFATGAHAANVMFEETGSLRALRSEVRMTPEMHPDLTMVSGRCLFPRRPEVGAGRGTRMTYQTLRAEGAELGHARELAAARLRNDLEVCASGISTRGVERQLLTRFLESVAIELQRLLHRVTHQVERVR